jgi:drug/metabolite transporter (DMT)-like permease
VSAPALDLPRAGRRGATAALALVGVTAVWGSTFPLSKDLLTRLPVTDYLALRFLLAAAVIGLARPGAVRRIDRRVLVAGAGLGLCYAAGQALQFFGLVHTPATVSAFVVSMYVVVTPLLGAVLFRARPSGSALAATVLAAIGVGTMSLRGWSLGFGEALTLGAAVLYALHILGLSRWSTGRTAYPLTFVQLLTMGLCFLGAAAHDGVQVPGPLDLLGFVYLAVVAGAGAMLVQTWAQSYVPAARAAVVMVLEPVWAALLALVVWDQALDGRTVVGGTLVVCATLLVVLRSRRAEVVASGAADAAGVGAMPPTSALPHLGKPGH